MANTLSSLSRTKNNVSLRPNRQAAFTLMAVETGRLSMCHNRTHSQANHHALPCYGDTKS